MRCAILSSALVATPSLFANTLYVVPPGTAGNAPTAPYDTWVTAANDLATAVAAASSQDTILVGKGTYSITGSTPIVMSGDKAVVFTQDVGLADVRCGNKVWAECARLTCKFGECTNALECKS